MKKCSVCLVNMKNSDYVNKNDECYKCVYSRKVNLLAEQSKGKKKKSKCKECECYIPHQRWKYCSDECAKKGKLKQKHWTLTCKSSADSWMESKRRFYFHHRPEMPPRNIKKNSV